MKYTITHRSHQVVVVYETKKPVETSSTDMYITDDVETCKSILKDYVDPPEYDLTEENIRKNFGEKIRNESIEQIRSYYNFRKQIFGDLLEDIKTSIPGVFRYEIPEESNHFELYDQSAIPPEEKQLEYYIELKIETN